MHMVGLLCGREYAFPPAFIAKVNQLGKKDGVAAEFVKLGGTRMGEPARYRVIVDRISHEVEYYRGYLKHAVLQGAYVINNPFWWTADDKYFNYSVAAKLGIAIPKTVLLPQKGYPKDVDITAESLHNMEYPIDWDGMLDYVGRPAILKPYSGGGWKNVYRVTNPDEFFEAYRASGQHVMTLQEEIVFQEYFRCYVLGAKHVRIMRYDPRQPHENRYVRAEVPIEPSLEERLRGDCLKLTGALGYEFDTVELAVRDGIPYAIDFLNPAPDADVASIGADNFEWIVDQSATWLVERVAEGPRPSRAWEWQRAREEVASTIHSKLSAPIEFRSASGAGLQKSIA